VKVLLTITIALFAIAHVVGGIILARASGTATTEPAAITHSGD